ncbi:ABC transporter permease [candidate division KSB1 bacterium]|nr:ABC transporter permease [candidate division KSB1 bacterium]
MFPYYLKTALRHISKYKSLSFINITGLVLGLMCIIIIFSWIQYEKSYDSFHDNLDSLYRIIFTNETRDFYGYYQPGPLAGHLRDVIPEITFATSYSEMRFKLSKKDKGFFCTGSYVTFDFFDMFSFPLLQGEKYNLFQNPASVVLTQKTALKLFGHTDPIGQTVKLNDGQQLTVSGVLDDIPENSHMQFDFVMPFQSSPDWMQRWDLKSTTTYVKLSHKNNIEQVRNKIYGIMNQHNPEWKNLLLLNPMKKAHLYNLEGGGLITYVYIFAAMGIVILLIACINFINLTIAYSEKRAKEIGMLKTVGSSQFSIIFQFLGEAMLFALFSMLFALFLVQLVSPYITDVLGRSIHISLSPGFLLILMGLTVITGIGAGLYPAIYFSRLQPLRMLTCSSHTGTGGRSTILRKTLVVVQFTLSIFFIVCLFGIRAQLKYIRSKELGYTRDCVIMVHTRGALSQKAPLVKKDLLQYTTIHGATVSGNELLSIRGTGSGPVEWPEKDTDEVVEAGFNMVDHDFFNTLNLKLALGRFFSKEFETDVSDAFVVNETAVKRMGFAEPIGREITINQGPFKRTGHIIGVVKDFHAGSLHQTMYPIVMMYSDRANYLFIRAEFQSLKETLAQIQNTIKAHVPDDPFFYEFLDEKIAAQYRIEQLTSALTLSLTILLLIISSLGLFGLTSYTIQRRIKEIGVRKVFGATVLSLLCFLGKDFTKWVLFANIFAWPIAWYAMNKWLQNFAYRMDLTIWPFLFAGLTALSIALLTVSWQVIRAATANPVKALRYE